MYNSQVQLICPVLIYATRASFKSLIAVFLHQNPRTCGTISVNLDIGSTGARGGGMIWLEAKPKAVYCQKCSVCCCWRFRQSLKVFSDLLKMFRTSCFCISFAWHGASGFLQQRLTRCEFELWPSEFTSTVFDRMKHQFLPTVWRNIGHELSGAMWVCAVFMSASSVINRQPVVSVFPTCCFRLRTMWPWKEVRKTVICSWQHLHVYANKM